MLYSLNSASTRLGNSILLSTCVILRCVVRSGSTGIPISVVNSFLFRLLPKHTFQAYETTLCKSKKGKQYHLVRINGIANITLVYDEEVTTAKQ